MGNNYLKLKFCVPMNMMNIALQSIFISTLKTKALHSCSSVISRHCVICTAWATCGKATLTDNVYIVLTLSVHLLEWKPKTNFSPKQRVEMKREIQLMRGYHERIVLAGKIISKEHILWSLSLFKRRFNFQDSCSTPFFFEIL